MPTTTRAARTILVDTNILLRLVNQGDSQHAQVVEWVAELERASFVLCFTPQNLRELWNVATRSINANGLGYEIAGAEEMALRIEALFLLLSDTDSMHRRWRSLVVVHQVKGVQVHDARLAAAALASDCLSILTFNDTDFKRFGIPTLHPRDIPDFIANQTENRA